MQQYMLSLLKGMFLFFYEAKSIKSKKTKTLHVSNGQTL
jgi:hypothetical protein